MGMRGIKKKLKWRRKHDKRRPFTLSEEAVECGIKAPKEMPSGNQYLTPNHAKEKEMAPGERYLTPSQAGKILNVTGACVKQWIFARRLRATQLRNGYWKIKAQDLLDYMKARQSLGQKKIMIIDTAHTKKAIEAVEELGHLPVVADSKSNALLKAADLYPSLFVINVSASELEPWKLIEQIRTTRNIRNAPMVLLSDKELSEEESDQALEMRVKGVLVRPFTAKKLKDEIERVSSRIL